MRKKRAWNNTNPLFRYLKSRKNKTKSQVTKKMARRKSFKSYAKKAYKNRNTNTGLLMTVGASMLYGGVRSKLSSMTAQYLPSFAGQYTDEVALGLLGWYLSKKGGIIGAVGKSALIIESASIGNQLVGGMLQSSTVTASSSYSA